ncbi:sister chromatid cohesion protein DCC1-like isoform X2 [Dysidea avara]|uniref:sister chromatid cohesion protein DCC1-like isoform X2 n=1 Tax=Dysidea avara TaxID=196820 RepID=UPI0033336241
MSSCRSQEEVTETARAAGVKSSKGPVQVLKFSDQLNSDDVKLFELPPKILSTLEAGDTVVLRGDRDDNAVLCTTDTTFELKLAETSNTMLLAPALSDPSQPDFQKTETGTLLCREVTACLDTYFEARSCRPQLDKLKRLLRESPYSGPEHEVMDDDVITSPQKYMFVHLLDIVQASEEELLEALKKLHACNIDGYWRLLDADYMDQSFQHILTLLEEEGWSVDHVPLLQCAGKLEELQPKFITEHCLACFGFLKNLDPERVYSLSERQVCQFYAELLLRPVDRFNYEEFMDCWKQSVPDGMNTSMDYLRGLALWDLNSMPPAIWHFPAYDLPEDPTARFNKLFKVRERWAQEDLEPYIRDLETPTQSLNALLLKFTRTSTNHKGQKLYNAKHSIK